MLVPVEHGADGVDGKIEPARDLAVGGLKPAAARGLRIEIGGKLGTIGAECLNLRRKLILAVIRLAPAFGRGLERIERRGKAPAGCIDCACVAHDYLPAPRGRRASIGNICLSKELPRKTYGL